MSDVPGFSQNDSLSEEIDTLKSIYVNEIEVDSDLDDSSKPVRITVQLYPSTVDKTEEQYVKLTLVLSLSQLYPDEIPKMCIRNARGISDEDLERINVNLEEKAAKSKGGPMIYELIELVKDFLTEGNHPFGMCCICLQGFHPDDAFLRTDCFHYFHSHCLSRYIQSQLADEEGSSENTAEQNSVPCPVCREAVSYNADILSSAPPPIENENAAEFTITEEVKEVQNKMKALYSEQKAKGGIIDVEEDKKKFLLEISTVPDAPLRNTPNPVPVPVPVPGNQSKKKPAYEKRGNVSKYHSDKKQGTSHNEKSNSGDVGEQSNVHSESTGRENRFSRSKKDVKETTTKWSDCFDDAAEQPDEMDDSSRHHHQYPSGQRRFMRNRGSGFQRYDNNSSSFNRHHFNNETANEMNHRGRYPSRRNARFFGRGYRTSSRQEHSHPSPVASSASTNSVNGSTGSVSDQQYSSGRYNQGQHHHHHHQQQQQQQQQHQQQQGYNRDYNQPRQRQFWRRYNHNVQSQNFCDAPPASSASMNSQGSSSVGLTDERFSKQSSNKSVGGGSSDNGISNKQPTTGSSVDSVTSEKQHVVSSQSNSSSGSSNNSKPICSMWTVCGPPPGFRTKPAFTASAKVGQPPPGFNSSS